ncbi:MAG: M20 family metallopeptidase [Fervidicoccaceae archaeon]
MISESLRKEALSLLLDLIRVPTVSPFGEGYEEAIKILREFLDRYSVGTEIIRVPTDYQSHRCAHVSSKPRYILRGFVDEGGRLWLQLNGHYDVVPGGSGWTKTSPFEPLVEGDRVYGRGSTDMKGGIVSMALALVLYAESARKADCRLDAIFVPDEEVGGECGTGYYVETLKARKPDYVIIAEPSSPKYIYIGHRGVLWARVKVRGKSAHASVPWLGVNAFLDAAKLALWLEENYVATIASVRSSYEYDVPNAGTPTAMIGGEAGVPGGKVNQVPGEAYFTIDRRLIVEEKTEDVAAELRAAVATGSKRLGLNGDRVELEIVSVAAPALVPRGNPLSLALIDEAEKKGLPRPREAISAGGLDSRYYVEKGILTVAYGPGVHKLSHSPDEYVNFEEVLKFSEIYASLPAKLSGS